MAEPIKQKPYFALKTLPPETLVSVFLTNGGFEIGWAEGALRFALDHPEARTLVEKIAERIVTSFGRN